MTRAHPRPPLPREPFLDDDDDDEEEEGDEEPEGEPCAPGGAKDGAGLMKLMLKSRTVLVSAAVSDELTAKVAAQVLLMEQQSPEKPILVIVNSPGGSADSGFALLDLLRFVRCPVHTLAAGIVASAAVMIYLGGDPEHRYALPNARFLLHQPSTMVTGPSSDLDITAAEIVRLRERYNAIVARETGRPREQVDRDANRDFWLDAAQAHEYGLVKRLITHRAELDR